MTALDETSKQQDHQDRGDSGQQRAHRVLADLLVAAAAQNLPPIDWRIGASGACLTGRCTAYPDPGRRRVDFEAWCTLLGARACEEPAAGQAMRLTARAERDNGLVTIEIIADLYDDLTIPRTAPAPHRSWRSP